jgi:hypothetical protein
VSPEIPPKSPRNPPNLFNEIGKGLRPKVRCVMPIADRGAGLPDGGFFAATQFQKAADAKPRPGALPERGVVEAPKSVLCPPKSACGTCCADANCR